MTYKKEIQMLREENKQLHELLGRMINKLVDDVKAKEKTHSKSSKKRGNKA